MMIKAIHEGNLKAVENILEENTHLLMAELHMEKLSFLPAGKIIAALKSVDSLYFLSRLQCWGLSKYDKSNKLIGSCCLL